MSKLLLKALNLEIILRRRASVTSASSPFSHNLFYLFIQSHPLSSPSSIKSIENSLTRSSFTVNYLVNSCGFTPERARLASKYMNFKVADKPDSVFTFFKDQGFTHAQILKVINALPLLLKCNPEKNFLPKIEFLKSKGISDLEVAELVSKSPSILTRSLENFLVPLFNLFSDVLRSKEEANGVFRRLVGPFFANANHAKANIEVLKQAGVPIKNIKYFVSFQTKTFFTSQDKFRQIVEEVKKFGFNPTKLYFFFAVHALKSISKSTWDRKVEVYKRWGWSENDVVHAFKKNPWCMVSSEGKITSVMEYLVNKMGLKSLVVADKPILLRLSMEKRIVPRCEVFQALVLKGVISPGDIRLSTILNYSEKQFQERFVDPHMEAYPELMKLYKQKVGSCKISKSLED